MAADNLAKTHSCCGCSGLLNSMILFTLAIYCNSHEQNLYQCYCSLFHCSNGHLDVVTYLVQKCGANVNSSDIQNWTPLHHACWLVCVLIIYGSLKHWLTKLNISNTIATMFVQNCKIILEFFRMTSQVGPHYPYTRLKLMSLLRKTAMVKDVIAFELSNYS